jgi:FdhD protein
MHHPVQKVNRRVWKDNCLSDGIRAIPEETALALTYNGGTYAVMMGTPKDLNDFAIGFSLGEGIIRSPDDIETVDIVDCDGGIELRMWLTQDRSNLLSERRRHITGPTGCGLCGIESIAEAVRPAGIVAQGQSFSPEAIMTAMQSIQTLQSINIETRAVHAAGFWTPSLGIVTLREDVGRHNALDKLAGAVAQRKLVVSTGLVLLTSRISVEMVQKAAAMGVPVVVAVSSPTALAVRTADAAGITLVGIARADGFEIFTHPGRIVPPDEKAGTRRLVQVRRSSSIPVRKSRTP